MKLSIVATLYRSAPNLREFYERTTAIAKRIFTDDFEILLVNDGSPDDSLDLAIGLTEKDPHLVLIDLSRHFGHHKAMMTGMAHSEGELVFLIDSDLEEQPEWLEAFWHKMNEVQCDVVYGVQERRKGRWFERWSGQSFYRIFNLLSGLGLPENLLTARLMSRRYVDGLLQHRERELFLAGLWHIVGFEQSPYTVEKKSTSKTTYTFRRKVSLLVNSVTSFSSAPVKGIFYFGAFISLFSFIYIGYLIAHWLFLETPLSGWEPVIASIWLMGGAVISFIGITGIYISKVLSETKQRPLTIVRRIYGRH